MSMHKKPLTTAEEAGIIAHLMGESIGRPSQAVDLFRSGVAWGQMSTADQIDSIQRMIDYELPVDETLRDRLAELLLTMQAALRLQNAVTAGNTQTLNANDGHQYPITLPPCPLCGGALSVTHIGNAFTKVQKLNVKCANTKCRIERTDAAKVHSVQFLIRCQERAWQNKKQEQGE